MQTQQNQPAASPAPAPVTEAARPRRYKMRANAKCGKADANGTGAFTGVCLVYEGDEFFLTIPTISVKVRDADGKYVRDRNGEIKRATMDGKIPSWCDALAEYPLDSTPQPLRVMSPT